MLAVMLRFFTGPLGGIAAAGAIVVGLVASFAYQQQSVGARKLEARTEKANAEVRRRADNAARKSIDPAAAGLRNPHYRAD